MRIVEDRRAGDRGVPERPRPVSDVRGAGSRSAPARVDRVALNELRTALEDADYTVERIGAMLGIGELSAAPVWRRSIVAGSLGMIRSRYWQRRVRGQLLFGQLPYDARTGVGAAKGPCVVIRL